MKKCPKSVFLPVVWNYDENKGWEVEANDAGKHDQSACDVISPPGHRGSPAKADLNS